MGTPEGRSEAPAVRGGEPYRRGGDCSLPLPASRGAPTMHPSSTRLSRGGPWGAIAAWANRALLAAPPARPGPRPGGKGGKSLGGWLGTSAPAIFVRICEIKNRIQNFRREFPRPCLIKLRKKPSVLDPSPRRLQNACRAQTQGHPAACDRGRETRYPAQEPGQRVSG
jgi:hypothetical protein